MAIRLSKAFGSSAEGWMGLQLQHDTAQAEERAKKIKVNPYHGNLISAYQ